MVIEREAPPLSFPGLVRWICQTAIGNPPLRVCDAPLQESESVPAPFAPEGINVKEAYQMFRTDTTGSSNVFARAPGTNRLRH
jgi:hypothetical protein